jgi:hypothetical protein
MKPIFVACALAASACIATFPVAAHDRVAAAKPYEFRGLPLGIALDDFRRREPARATPPESVAICDTDAESAALGMTLKSAQSMTIACRWAYRDVFGWRASQAVVDGAPARDHVLSFVALPGDTSPRLYRMSFVMDARVAADLAEALKSRYGAGRTHRAASGSTRVWDNGVSSITLDTDDTSATGSVTYRLKSAEAYLKRETATTQASAK